jgi:protein involved in polysaccharide export with SLBB domain
MTTEEIGAFVHDRLSKGDNLAQAAKALVEYAYYIGSGDNLSVQIVDNSMLGTMPLP